MADLSVNLCGISLKNPIIAASGTVSFGEVYSDFFDLSELGGISLKALTAEKREGNPPPRIAETASGIINSVGLQNPGVDAFIKFLYPNLESVDTCVIANVAGSSVDEYITTIKKLNETNIPIIELNISCPNVSEGGLQFGASEEAAFKVTQAARQATSKKLIVKLTPNVTDITAIAKAVEDAGADAVSLVNTLLAMAIDVRKKRPVLHNVTGGLSGPAIKPIALRMVHQVYHKVKIPIVGMGGIMTGTDVAEFMLAGATAVMTGTANMVTPDQSIKIIKEFNDCLDAYQIKTAAELTGSLILE